MPDCMRECLHICVRWEEEEVAGRLQRAAMSYSLSKLREKGEEKEGSGGRRREGYMVMCVALGGLRSLTRFVDIRKLKLRKHACCCSLYEVACLTVGLRCIVLLDNLFLTDTKWLHSTCYAKPQSCEAESHVARCSQWTVADEWI